MSTLTEAIDRYRRLDEAGLWGRLKHAAHRAKEFIKHDWRHTGRLVPRHAPTAAHKQSAPPSGHGCKPGFKMTFGQCKPAKATQKAPPPKVKAKAKSAKPAPKAVGSPVGPAPKNSPAKPKAKFQLVKKHTAGAPVGHLRRVIPPKRRALKTKSAADDTMDPEAAWRHTSGAKRKS